VGNAAVGKKCLFITLVGLNPTTKVSFRCLSAPPNVSQSLSVPQYSGPGAPFIPRRLCERLEKKRRLTETFEEGRNEKKIIENVAPATVTFPASDSYIRQIYIANARCVAGAV
jgi:hypothetical protein